MLSDAWSDLILFKSISHLISSRFQTNKRKRPQCLYICGRGTTEISRINCCRCGLDKEKLSNFENFFLHVDVDWMSYNNKMLFLNSFVANRQGKAYISKAYGYMWATTIFLYLQICNTVTRLLTTVPVLSNLPVSHLLI